MAITTAMATSFKSELLQGIHNFHNGSGGGMQQLMKSQQLALITQQVVTR